MSEEPSAFESVYAIFANDLEIGPDGEPTNEKYAERRAASYLYSYVTGHWPDGEPELADGEADLY